MKKLRISIKEFITFYSINNLYKAKIPVYRSNNSKIKNFARYNGKRSRCAAFFRIENNIPKALRRVRKTA